MNAFGYTESLNNSCATIAQLAGLNPPLGYMPAQGFGLTNVTEDGMSWNQIRDAVSALTGNPSGIYGGSLQLRSTRYLFDLSELPLLDANFRINGDNVTLLELVSQVCSAAGMDYFIETLYFAPNYVPPGYGGISGHLHPDVWKFIKVRTSGRYVQKTSAYNVDLTVNSPIDNRLALGAISSFVGNGVGKNRISRGLELRNDITNSFLIGDNRQDLWQQPYSGSGDTYTDTIWPYWGVDNLGFPIISEDVDNDHNFTISTEGWHPKLVELLGDTYNINMLEIRCALAGMEEWKLYMITEKNVEATAIKLDAAFLITRLAAVLAGGAFPKPDDGKNTGANAIRNANRAGGNQLNGEVIKFDELQNLLFETVKSYGDLAGKKFMVALPLICSAPDESAPFAVKMNWQKSDGAWTDANVQLNPLADPLVPNSPILERFRIDDGRIECFVYFNTQDEDFIIDYSKLSPDDVVPISETECYVRATLEEITFLNPIARTYPRAIISLSSQIVLNRDKDKPDAPVIDGLWHILIPEDADDIKKKGQAFGDDTNKLPIFPFIIMPIGAAVPLRSTNLCYGPWKTTLSFGPAAKTAYERDTSINPWNFGGTTIMNYAGQVKVETQVTQQIVNEAGSLTVPGAPTGRLGSLLIAGGPEITNVDVQVGIGGVTTSLRFRTWVQNFGEIGRRRVQNLRQAGTYQQKLQRAFIKNNFAPNAKVAVGNWIRELTKSDRFNRNSSHTIIAGQLINDYPDVELKRPNVVMTDLRKVLPETYDDYEKKALMDLTGLFRPFETEEVSGHGLPSFKQVTPEDGEITDVSLNPFKTSEIYNGASVGHDIEYIARGNSLDDIEDLSIKKEGSHGDGPFRGLGLRAPVVLVGWGFDINDKPVPNESDSEPTDNFINDYLQKTHLWKAGPLDVRWDEDRGVWSAAGGTAIIKARLTSTLGFRGSASANIFRYDPQDDREEIYSSGNSITVYDWLLPSGSVVSANTNVFVSAEKGGSATRYYVINASCVTSEL